MADFLDQVLGDAAPEPIVEPPAPEPAAPEPIPETVEAPPPPAEPAEPEQRGPGFVPIDAMLTEREKRQAAERRVAEFEAQQKPANVPDPFDNPGDYTAYMRQELQTALQAQKVDMSWAFAVQQHGADKVQAAKDWALDKAQKDLGFRSMLDTEFATQTLPIDWVVQQHQREEAMGKLGGKTLDDWFNEELARRNLTSSAPAPAAPVLPVAAIPALRPAAPPRSIAADASPAAPAQSDHPMAGLDAIFDRR